MKLTLLIECDCREKAIAIPITKDSDGEYCLSNSIDDSQRYFQTLLSNPYNMYVKCICGKEITITY